MARTMAQAFSQNFLGNSPIWYKQTIIAFLIINPFLAAYSPFVAGWVLVLEFIFTLAMALKCYPLQPGGLLAIEAILHRPDDAGARVSSKPNTSSRSSCC